MVRVFSATPVFEPFHEYMRRAPQQKPTPTPVIVKAELQPLESSHVVISDEARRRLAAEQSRPHWDWDM